MCVCNPNVKTPWCGKPGCEMPEQAQPTKNDRPCIQDLVIADIEQRKAVGLQRYGTLLQPFNGRDSNRDAYEEALDLCQYLKQDRVERAALIEMLRYAREQLAASGLCFDHPTLVKIDSLLTSIPNPR